MSLEKIEKHEITTSDKTKYLYQINPKHRAKTPTDVASIWHIKDTDEVNCFQVCAENKYMKDYYGWGYLLQDGKLCSLGKCLHNGELVTDVKLAKFTDGDKINTWHGWPFNYKRNKDIIPDSILEKWVENGAITKVKMSKIKQKQKCNL